MALPYFNLNFFLNNIKNKIKALSFIPPLTQTTSHIRQQLNECSLGAMRLLNFLFWTWYYLTPYFLGDNEFHSPWAEDQFFASIILKNTKGRMALTTIYQGRYYPDGAIFNNIWDLKIHTRAYVNLSTFIKCNQTV